MSGVKASIGVRMQNAWCRHPAVKTWDDAVPTDSMPLTPMTKRTSPQAPQPMPEGTHRAKISRHSVVLIEPLRDAAQPGPDLIERLVHPDAQPLLDLLQLPHPPLISRLAPHHPQTPPPRPTLVGAS